MDTREQELRSRLDDLEKFQEEQEKMLKAKQSDQRALLTREQIQMYEMLGLSISNFAEVSAEPINIESENENEFEEVFEVQPEDEANESSHDESIQSQPATEYNNELVKKNIIISPLKNIEEFHDEENENVVKRPFLKRGAGLTTRFRIAPDAFNLKKLPPYKYTERVRKSLGRAAPASTSEQAKVVPAVRRRSEPENVKKASAQLPPAAARKPPSAKAAKLSEKVQPEKLSPSESVDLLIPSNVVLKVPTEPIDAPVEESQIQEWFNSRFKEKQPEILETPKVSKAPKGVSWAQILSSNNIADGLVNVDHLLNPASLENESNMDETDLFHLLEERVNNMSLDVSMSTIMKLLATMKKSETSQRSQDDEDQTLVNPHDPIIKDSKSVNLQLQPHPTDVNEPINLDDTTDDENESGIEPHEEEEEEEEEEEDTESSNERNRVRFSENVEVVDAIDLSTDIEGIELSQTSTPNDRQKFQDFKKRIFGHNKPAAVPQRCDDLKEKSDLMKTKLTELQHEIASVRQQNAAIMKMRQELELEKIQIDNERDDLLEKIKDDKIKMELQLHDERLKLDQEKQKFEKAKKIPSKQEREEIAKLKESIEELREELKTKEVRHGSTSVRYRSQIKQLEKENQSMKLELDVFKKENKKLELENARLRKDTNSKMLQEINRNIAKLAPQELNKQPEVAKKSATRKSEPLAKKRTKSVPNLVEFSSASSSDEEVVKPKRSSEHSKENNPAKTRRSVPVKISQTSTPCSDVLGDMKREIANSDGSKDIWYPNGNLKKISPDGMLIRMLYYNRDIKETNINEGTVKYYYNDTNTWHTTYIDGLEILEYADGQIEHRYKDGTNEVHYQNGSIRITNPNWTDDTKEEWRLPDGTNIKILTNESKILSFPNGQREIHTPNHKRREFPDGTVKLAYDDGSFETRYSNGRIRIKDNKGNLISDTMAN